MAKIAKVAETLKDAGEVKAVWQAIPDFKMGAISLDDFVAANDAAEGAHKEYEKKDVELTGIKASRDEKVRDLGELVTRFRSGIRSTYGPDSVMYEHAGGIRSSLRKAPSHKVKATLAAIPAVTPHS